LDAGFVAGLLCALLVYYRRQPRGVERIAWWLTLGAFGLLTLSVVGDYFTPWMDQAFMIGVGAIMLFLAATTLLGVMLIKNRFRPRGTAVIMVAQLPLFLLIASITRSATPSFRSYGQ
jgi:peptidoglycan/LPS O-acetylase OafA/YrhL